LIQIAVQKQLLKLPQSALAWASPHLPLLHWLRV